MAGITTGSAGSLRFKHIHASSLPSSSPKCSPFQGNPLKVFSLSEPNTVRVRFPTRRTVFFQPIVARYGGLRFSGEIPRNYQNDSDDERALDVRSIRSASVRLIDENQNMVGVVAKDEAMRRAEDAELDLVILSPEADPPVVKIMDYDKYRYEQQKKKKGQQKKSAASRMDIKELKMGYNIDEHDYGVRLKAARKFLNDGDKVKIIVNLKGRENEFRNIAIELIRRFQKDVGELATEESKNFKERNIFITLVPNKILLQKAAQEQQAKRKDKPLVDELSANV